MALRLESSENDATCFFPEASFLETSKILRLHLNTPEICPVRTPWGLRAFEITRCLASPENSRGLRGERRRKMGLATPSTSVAGLEVGFLVGDVGGDIISCILSKGRQYHGCNIYMLRRPSGVEYLRHRVSSGCSSIAVDGQMRSLVLLLCRHA